MKIGLTVKGSGLGAWLDDDFVNCRQVMFVDDDDRFESWMNPYQKGDDFSSVKLADKIIAENIDILITGQITQQISQRFQDSGIEVVVKNEGGAVLDCVEEVRNLFKGP